MSNRPFVIPVFLSHMGCPHRCVFCNQHAITGRVGERIVPTWVADRIERFLAFKTAARTCAEVAFYGGNFLGLAADHRESLLAVAQSFIDAHRVDGIRFSTRPDTITPCTLQQLAPYRVTTIEMGVQSLDDGVLAASRRGHTAEDVRRAAEMLQGWGGRIGVQLMPGLPGDTLSSILETAKGVAALGPDFVRIYPTVVIRGTVLEAWYRSGRFQPLSLKAAVDVAKQLYIYFQSRGISVVRMGLHPDEALLEGGNVVAGPFHPAFGHLVHAAVFLDRIVEHVETVDGVSKRISLQVHPSDLSRAVGDRRNNIQQVKARFDLEGLTVTTDSALPPGQIRVQPV